MRACVHRHGLPYHDRESALRELVFRGFRRHPMEPILGARPSAFSVTTFLATSSILRPRKTYENSYKKFPQPGLQENLRVLSDFMNGFSLIDVLIFLTYSKNSWAHINLYLLEGLTLDKFYGWCDQWFRSPQYFKYFNVLLVPLLSSLLVQKNAIAWAAVDPSGFRPHLDLLLNPKKKIEKIMDGLIRFANEWLNEQCRLRKFTLSEIRHMMEILATELEELCRRSPPLPHDLRLYRGVRTDYLEIFGYTENRKRFTYNPSFSSATLNRSHARAYAGSDCCLFDITVPAGSRIILLQAATFYREDYEVVLPSNTRFEVVATGKDGDRKTYALRYCG